VGMEAFAAGDGPPQGFVVRGRRNYGPASRFRMFTLPVPNLPSSRVAIYHRSNSLHPSPSSTSSMIGGSPHKSKTRPASSVPPPVSHSPLWCPPPSIGALPPKERGSRDRSLERVFDGKKPNYF
jgi:hypothetical protein